MKILYASSTCSDKKFNQLCLNSDMYAGHAVQKYHSLLIDGLSQHNSKVVVISGLPINRRITSQILINEKNERIGNVFYRYITSLNLPVLRQLFVFLGTFFSVLAEKKEDDTYGICDCLNLASSYGLVFACKIKRIPILTIVTDLPDDMEQSSSFVKKTNNALFGKMDGFVFLTEMMNERVNEKQKPFIVLEGHVDNNFEIPNDLKKYENEGKKVVIYAGSIKKLYGIQNLVEGFIQADIPDSQLRVFGDGDYREELEEIVRTHNNVEYCGVKPNAEIVDQEIRAALLVNPRPTGPEYTKYSFPSKNMEYMVSGTPMLTTRLPGIPKEYYPYVYFIDDESSQGIAQALKKVFDDPMSVRDKKGSEARKFVLDNKTNVSQARKIIEFLKSEVC